ncbi:MAG: prolipoprotein diacylglyceryl transferase [Vicinamibacteria bacterium]
MFPRLFTLDAFTLFGRSLGPFTLHTYGVLLALAFVLGLFVAARLARRSGLDGERVTDLAVYVLIAGLLGAKAALLIVEFPYYSKNPGELFSILQSGGVFYGGLIAALPVAWWYARRHGLPGWQAADALAPAVVLGQSVGRLGCFAAGCCYGKPSSLPWSVTFKDAYAARAVGTPVDVPLHPVQLYESALTLLIFFGLLALFGRKRFDGQVTLAYVLLYSVARFSLEFVRGDAVRGTVLGGLLSTSQFIAVVLALGALALWPWVARTQRIAAPAPPAA